MDSISQEATIVLEHSKPLANKSAIICGGSKGIGLETARRFLELGASVCIVARDQAALSRAAEQLAACACNDRQYVETIACDATRVDLLGPELNGFVDNHSVPDFLINMAGYAYAQYHDQLTLQDYRNSIEANFFGQLIPTLILLPHFVQAGKGHIAYTSSMMGYFGIMGYAAYAPAKFAVVGLAEALRNELKPQNIDISVLYPPDTATPGFAAENTSKPAECTLLSGKVTLMSAEEVAREFVAGLLKCQYGIYPGQSRYVWLVHRYFPGLLRWYTDRQFARARRQIGKQK